MIERGHDQWSFGPARHRSQALIGKPDEILSTPRTGRVLAFLKRYNDRYRI